MLCITLVANAARATVYQTRDAALRATFGAAAHLESRTAYLTPAQMDSVRRRAHAAFDTPRVTYWVASHGDTLLGRAYLDTHVVRTMPETVEIAVAPAGDLLAVRILAFHEPEDYLPPRRWLERLLGRKLSPHLRPGDGVDAITGASLSARALTDAARRVLALDRVLQEARP